MPERRRRPSWSSREWANTISLRSSKVVEVARALARCSAVPIVKLGVDQVASVRPTATELVAVSKSASWPSLVWQSCDHGRTMQYGVLRPASACAVHVTAGHNRTLRLGNGRAKRQREPHGLAASFVAYAPRPRASGAGPSCGHSGFRVHGRGAAWYHASMTLFDPASVTAAPTPGAPAYRTIPRDRSL
jgi:hypothetical protein